MRVLILFLGSIFLLTSCSTEQKEKELPSYFCNENLEKYFAGNDSLPIININPNDSFNTLKRITDSLENLDDYLATYSFNTLITPDSSFKPILFRISIAPYLAPAFVPLKKIYDFNKRNLLIINVVGENLYQLDTNRGNGIFLKKYIKEFVINNGKNPYLSDNPTIGIVSLSISKNLPFEHYIQALKTIIDGYRDILDTVSKEKYNKPYCSLSFKESIIISKIVPFKFLIGYEHVENQYIKPTLFVDL